MPSSPQPRYTSLSDFQAYVRTSGNSVPKQDVLPIILASAETAVERYCRRRFAPEPALSEEYTRQVIQIVAATGSQLPPQVTGTLGLAFSAEAPAPSGSLSVSLPTTAAALQAALAALPGVGVGNVVCTGGPLPHYPISVIWAGSLTKYEPAWTADSSGLSGGYCVVMDAGYDSLPPVAKTFTTRGKTEISVPDLRIVDASPDPRIPGSGAVQLGGQRLLAAQYDLGYDAWAAGGADQAIGSTYAEPSTEIKLGYWGTAGYPLAASFQFVAPIGFQPNDLMITGRWGWYPPPPDIVEAVYAIGSRGWAERDARFTDAFQTPEGAVLTFYKQLPARAKGALDTYRRFNMAFV